MFETSSVCREQYNIYIDAWKQKTFVSRTIQNWHGWLIQTTFLLRTIQYLHRCLKTKDPSCHLGNEWRQTFQTFQTFHWESKLFSYRSFASTLIWLIAWRYRSLNCEFEVFVQWVQNVYKSFDVKVCWQRNYAVVHGSEKISNDELATCSWPVTLSDGYNFTSSRYHTESYVKVWTKRFQSLYLLIRDKGHHRIWSDYLLEWTLRTLI